VRAIAVAGPIADVIEARRRQIETDPEREILYIEDGGGNWLSAWMDREAFVACLDALLDNVLRHGGPWGRITVTAEPVPGSILVRVRDNGAGIPEAVAADAAAGKLPAASGLGRVAGIVRAHGGRLAISSHPGAGSVVSTWWPAAPPAPVVWKGRAS